MCESGLRTISTARTRSHREVVFLCLKSSPARFFPHFITQSESAYINLLMRVQPRVYPGSIMFVFTQNP